jgi:hypothetical protein
MMTLTTSDGARTTLDDTKIAEFRSALRGDVMAADDAGYEHARHVWNGNIDRRPGLIARCAGVADVQQAVPSRERIRPSVDSCGSAPRAMARTTAAS